MKKIHIPILIIILFSFCLSAYLYPQMPAKMASHWNAAGEINGYMTKCWALYLMPLVTTLMYLMFLVIPKIDPLKKNIEKFRVYFDWFILLMVVFLFYIHLLTLAANLGYTFNMTTMMLPAIGALFIYISYLLPRAKRNWFIGIRTPWTLSSDKVWLKTHILGAMLFRIAGALTIASVFFQSYAIWIVLISALVAGLYPIVYSYFEYQKK
ncbi:SdpI family protein [Candidatus Peregrinibacteria bacterium]|nr:SdpI family protein [Candidatus Peregrinibacteria bacterium]